MRTVSYRFPVFLLILLTACCLSDPAHAQSDEAVQAEPEATPPVRKNMISANPFGLLLEWYNVEYERAVSKRATLALSGSYIKPDDDDEGIFFNFSARYYPRAALHGFFVGGRLGLVNVDTGIDSGTGYSFGFEIAYNWLLGEPQQLGIGLGLGLNRIFGGDIKHLITSDGDDVNLVWPTFRVNLGFAW